jgi:hypothetical protein
MALQSIKEVINNQGVFLTQKDREIFQLKKENLASFFGLSTSDAIEFILYDVNNNQLPQKNFGNVRYVPLSSENIRDYFLVSDTVQMVAGSLPEYFIDAERLIKEAGYTSGIFKVQITLINKRVGSNSEGDKLWIQEISRSRTEVRLRPLLRDQTEEVKTNLIKRFEILSDNKEFREDVEPILPAFLDKINSVRAQNFLSSKYADTEFIQRLKAEFKIADFPKFLSDVQTEFTKAVNYEFTNRNSDINANNYGQLKNTSVGLDLSLEEVDKRCKVILGQCINKYLPPRNYNRETTSELENNASPNVIETLIQTQANPNSTIDTKEVVLRTTTQNPAVEVKKGVYLKAPQTTTVSGTGDTGGDTGGGTIVERNNDGNTSRAAILDSNVNLQEGIVAT